MKIFNINGTSAYDIVHMIGSKDTYSITENVGSITYENSERKYIVNNVEEFKFKHIDNQGKGKFKWNEEFAPFGIKKNCLEWLNSGATNDGVYTINYGSGDKEVYCDMNTNGGGWTMITSQKNGYWFSSAEADLYTAENASPNANKYSIMQHIDEITTNKEYKYLEHREDGIDRWIITTQDESPFTSKPDVGSDNNRYDTPTGKMNGYALLDYSHAPADQYLDGFGITVGGAASCKHSSNLYNWIWCITQLQVYVPITSPMVGGYYDDGATYNLTRHTKFWTR